MNKLSSYVRSERCRRGLTPQALAGLVGYRNVDRGANRIATFERDGQIAARLLDLILDALQLDPERCRVLAEEDRDDLRARFEVWASESVAPQFYLVPMPAVQIRQSLPPSARDDRNAAERFALKTAKKRDCRAVLVWNRRWTFWIARDGQGWWSETTPGRPNEPLATVGNKSLRLGFE